FSACCAASTIEMCQGIDFHGSPLGGCKASKMAGKLVSARSWRFGASGFSWETTVPARPMQAAVTTPHADHRNFAGIMAGTPFVGEIAFLRSQTSPPADVEWPPGGRFLPHGRAGAVDLDDLLDVHAGNQRVAVGQADGVAGIRHVGLPVDLAFAVHLG